MTGAGGHDRLDAATSEFALSLDLTSSARPVLHRRDGWIDYGPAGGSYYYSRPRMSARGTLTLGAQEMTVDGTAWFDHQWGDFIALGGGGWDWFAVNLDDGSDLMLWQVRAADGSHPLSYGTLARPDGSTVSLEAGQFSITGRGSWTSPTTAITYPAAWRLELPREQLIIDLAPTVADQELDTRPSSGVIYWEGSQTVTATKAGQPLGGQAYVELTGYVAAR